MPASLLSRPRIGVIGVGSVAHAFAQRLVSVGFEVVAYDLNPATRAPLAKLGVRLAESPWAAVDNMQAVMVCVLDRQVLKGIIKEIAPALSSGELFIDATPGTFDEVRATMRELKELCPHVKYVEACVLSRSDDIRRGHGAMLIGADFETSERAAFVWVAIGGQNMHVGPPGTGARLKLISSVVAGLNRSALAEGLSLARTLGIDPMVALETLRITSAYSRVMDLKGEKMVQGDFAPQSKLSDHLKEVRSLIDLARGYRLPLHLSETNRRLLERAEQKGCGKLDTSAVISAYDPEAKPGKP